LPGVAVDVRKHETSLAAQIADSSLARGPEILASGPLRLNTLRSVGASVSIVSARLDPTWTVVASPATPTADRCVDIFARPNGTFGFEEFRRDPEDMGVWTPVAYYSGREYASESDALAAARNAVPWLTDVLDA